MRVNRSTLCVVLAALVGGLLVTAAPAHATFPGANGLILFNRGGDLYTSRADGSAVTRLTRVGGITGAKWSPDGTRIAFRRNDTIKVRTVATGRTTTVATEVDSAPQWSPDGARIAFVAGVPDAPCGEQAVYSVPSAGGAGRLDYDPHSDNCPHGTDVFGLGNYLPDGGSILLTTCYAYYDSTCTLAEVELDGSNAARPIVEIGCSMESELPEDGSPSRCSFPLHLSDGRVGPGGNGVFFSGKGGYEPTTGTLPGSTAFPTSETLEKVYRIGRLGSGLSRVSTASNGRAPVLSPDGATLLFVTRDGQRSHIVAVDGTLSTAQPTVLVRNATQPDWQAVG